LGKRLSKIYTRTGDKGDTGLGDGSRLPKDHARVHAMGSIDETNSQLGLLIEEIRVNDDVAPLIQMADFLRRCQHRLFDLGGEVSIPGYKIINEEHIVQIENALDELNANLAPLENFIMPGGNRLIAQFHVVRSVCRRAERDLISLSHDDEVNPEGLKLLNRFSDYLFVAARYTADILKVPEVLWEKG